MKNTAIQWCDHTFNPWEGCTKVAPECKNCYAETLVDHRFSRTKWGKGQPRRRTSAAYWRQPIKWGAVVENERQNEMELGPSRLGRMQTPRVFCLSLGDWLDEEVDILWLADLLELIDSTRNLDWLLLTKRPENWFHRLQRVDAFRFDKDRGIPHAAGPFVSRWLSGEPPPNVWIGVSAGADQTTALDIPAKIHFLSCEPMLHGMDVNYPEPFQTVAKFDWIIFGGESGKHARPCDVDWIRQGLAFCRANNTAPFVKQLGANVVGREMDKWVRDVRDSHGGDMNEWPSELRVREFPGTLR